MPTDDELDAKSRDLMNEIDKLKGVEREKRGTARSSERFHTLAEELEAQSRRIFDMANRQRRDGEEDSPIQTERDEQHPGDWTEGSRT